jgi:flagellar motor switch protein FliN/FliY
MEKELFSPMAIDALGEIMNISLGSSATAVSNMLDHRVEITTPKVAVVKLEDFELGNLEPALGIEIRYVEGLEGGNIMLLKRSDVKVIVDILMGAEMPDEEFELNELTISAVCEVMNQMMGAASTAMSDFLGFPVNISTPEPFEVNDLKEFKKNHMPHDLVVVRFKLNIENALESEFMYVMSVDMAKSLLNGLGLGDEVSADEEQAVPAGDAPAAEPEAPTPSQEQPAPTPQQTQEPTAAEPEPESGGGKLSQEEIERLMRGAGEPEQEPAPAPAPTPTPAPAPTPTPAPAAAAPAPTAPTPPPAPTAQVGWNTTTPGQNPVGPDGGYMGYPPMYYQQPVAGIPQPKAIHTQPMPMQQFDVAEVLGQDQAQNLDLIMEVPLQVTVEIGRTQRKVQDILSYSKGSLVVLDKLAGDQVDLLVNGKCIARGDVVVIEDNFGVRITEIMQRPSTKDLVK